MAVGFEGLVEMLKWNREQKPLEEDELDKNLCPLCDWKLKINEKTGERACPICERIY